MSPTAQMEQFSNSFIHALAAAGGCSVAKPSVDDDSVDWTLSNRLPRRPRLDIQLKSTRSDDAAEGEFLRFPIKRKNYDDLRLTNLIVPRILVVVLSPAAVEDWLECRPEEWILRKCALWHSLRGARDTENETSVTIPIPVRQAFDVGSLRMLMEKVDSGGAP